MKTASILTTALNVDRKFLTPGAVRPRGGERPIVRVLEPSDRRVHSVRCFLNGVHALPVSRRVTSVNRLQIVEASVANWNEVGVEIGYVAL